MLAAVSIVFSQGRIFRTSHARGYVNYIVAVNWRRLLWGWTKPCSSADGNARPADGLAGKIVDGAGSATAMVATSLEEARSEHLALCACFGAKRGRTGRSAMMSELIACFTADVSGSLRPRTPGKTRACHLLERASTWRRWQGTRRYASPAISGRGRFIVRMYIPTRRLVRNRIPGPSSKGYPSEFDAGGLECGPDVHPRSMCGSGGVHPNASYLFIIVRPHDADFWANGSAPAQPVGDHARSAALSIITGEAANGAR